MPEPRFYLATSASGKYRLVEGTNQAQVFRHLARQEWTVRPATARDYHECAIAGIKPETQDPQDSQDSAVDA